MLHWRVSGVRAVSQLAHAGSDLARHTHTPQSHSTPRVGANISEVTYLAREGGFSPGEWTRSAHGSRRPDAAAMQGTLM